MNKITIKHLAPSEWLKYKTLRLEALKTEPTAFAETYENVIKDSDKVWEERLQKSQAKNGQILLFAEVDKNIVGMVGGFWDLRKKIRHVGHIYGTYVKPNFRSCGIGKLLMLRIINELKTISSITKIRIEVNAHNLPAFELYKKLGFKVIGKAEKELLVDNVFYDEILMEMLL